MLGPTWPRPPGLLTLILPLSTLAVIRPQPLPAITPPLLPSDNPEPSTLDSSPPCASPSSPAADYVTNTSSFLPFAPTPTPFTELNFMWGTLDANSFQKIITEACTEVVHSWKIYFTLPFDQYGNSFVSKLGLFLRAYDECSSLESIALKAVTIIFILLLQCHHPRAKTSQPLFLSYLKVGTVAGGTDR